MDVWSIPLSGACACRRSGCHIKGMERAWWGREWLAAKLAASCSCSAYAFSSSTLACLSAESLCDRDTAQTRIKVVATQKHSMVLPYARRIVMASGASRPQRAERAVLMGRARPWSSCAEVHTLRAPSAILPEPQDDTDLTAAHSQPL